MFDVFEKIGKLAHGKLFVRRKTGFTLLEVMLAITIMGIVVVLVLNLFSGALRNQRKGMEYMQASLLARTKMDEVLLATDLESGEREGMFSEPYSDYSWHCKVSQADTSTILEEAGEELDKTNLVPKIFKVEVRVTWQEGAKQYLLNTMKTVVTRSENYTVE
jgi:type II secretion system protein I